MIAALLAPGPSLLRAAPVADYIVGVNRAPYIVRDRLRVDEWCFGDGNPYCSIMMQDASGLGYVPKIFCAFNGEIDIRNAGFDPRGYAIRHWETVFPKWPPQWTWTEWSATAGLIACADAGAKLIRCYGCDWTLDQADPDGVHIAQNTRTEQRWKDEKVSWDIVTRELALKGIGVERIAP